MNGQTSSRPDEAIASVAALGLASKPLVVDGHARGIVARDPSAVRILGEQKAIHLLWSRAAVEFDFLSAQQRLPEAPELAVVEMLFAFLILE